MNFDDDSQLSAFLDDELDPGDRMAVAWEVESSTATARQLADLQVARDLIRGLDRPAIPGDLAAAVLAGLAARQPRPTPGRSPRGARRLAAAIVGVASMAATLMLAVVVLHRPLHDDARPWLFSRLNPAEQARHDLDPLLAAPTVAAEADRAPLAPSSFIPSDLARSRANPRVAKPTAANSVRAAEVTAAKEPNPARPGQVDAMLGHRKVFRALIIADVFDQASRDVRSIIERDGLREPEFGRITLAQGIVIDPDHPGEAEVYSVVMDEPSLRPFLDQLRAKFPGVELQAETEPALVTQLSEVGQVAVFADVRPARLGLPPREIPGIVAAIGGGQENHIPAPAVAQFDPTQPPAGGFAGDPLDRARFADKADARADFLGKAARSAPVQPKTPTIPRISTEPVTLLVWVARPPRP